MTSLIYGSQSLSFTHAYISQEVKDFFKEGEERNIEQET